jgi:hypothetical protein
MTWAIPLSMEVFATGEPLLFIIRNDMSMRFEVRGPTTVDVIFKHKARPMSPPSLCKAGS